MNLADENLDGSWGRPAASRLRSQLHVWLVYVTTMEPLVHHGL
jgi:hypothetical protein